MKKITESDLRRIERTDRFGLTRRTFTRGALSAALAAPLLANPAFVNRLKAKDFSGKKLKVMINQPHAGSIEPLAAGFAELTGAEVEGVPVPYDQLRAQAILDVVSGTNEFDVFEYFYVDVEAMVEDGVIADVTDRIEAERDVHIDQAKAMGNALQNAQIRMYGGGGGEDGTLDTLRGLFTQGFGLGEVLEGFAQSLPDGLRQRFNANGLRGLIGRPYTAGSMREIHDHVNALVQEHMSSKSARNIPTPEAFDRLEEHAGDNEAIRSAVRQLRAFNQDGVLDEVPFDTVWTLIQAAARAAD